MWKNPQKNVFFTVNYFQKVKRIDNPKRNDVATKHSPFRNSKQKLTYPHATNEVKQTPRKWNTQETNAKKNVRQNKNNRPNAFDVLPREMGTSRTMYPVLDTESCPGH
ncbi:hypothetical protein JTE90_021452 [Oedothorax gibbosus]|uniref:Uncharacterized protein n=1 Tax=Oedothorax gibbosus TaxID=931172 RepID=A0AAV6VZ37_9ARAC|nr:hypothetical protein JTE90_021452 [Oedothorax gibbosus]